MNYDFKWLGETVRAIAITAIVAALQVMLAQDPERVLDVRVWGIAAISAAVLAGGSALLGLLTRPPSEPPVGSVWTPPHG